MNDKRHDRRDAELDRYFALARQAPPDISGVERNFETRVMARIRGGRDPWYAWAWRLARLPRAYHAARGWSLSYSPLHPADPVTMLASGPRKSRCSTS